MRRTDREILDFYRMVEILSVCDIAHVGMVDEQGLPYIVPVNFGFSIQDETVTIYFHGAKVGKKAKILYKQGAVTVCIDRNLGFIDGQKACAFGVAYQSVMLFGRVAVLENEQDKRMALSAMMQKASKESLPFDKTALQRTAVFAVQAKRWSAKECPMT